MAETVATASLNIGFLTVLHEASGQLGGYLVTNGWGRPLEFRLSTAVQPNRVQQVLYGRTLQAYICADLIGKTLLDKTGTPAALVVTDRDSVLELRRSVAVPVLWLAPRDDPRAEALAQQGAVVRPARDDRGPALCHPQFPQDAETLRGILEGLDEAFDLAEPFGRIREAIGEARKMGATRN